MPSNLPAAVNLGEIGACILRGALLDSDCGPLGGNGTGFVTAGLIDATATPEVEEGTEFAPKNGCGATLYSFTRQDRIKRYNLDGNIGFFDHEIMYLMFGGNTINGAGGGPFAGDTIGWAAPNYNSAVTNGIYLEIITQRIGEGAGDCVAAGTGFPPYVGHIFGKVLLVPGERTFQDDALLLAFTGKALANPNLFNGPWNDFPGVVNGSPYIPNSPYVTVGYSQEQYDAIAADVAPGWQDLPAGS